MHDNFLNRGQSIYSYNSGWDAYLLHKIGKLHVTQPNPPSPHAFIKWAHHATPFHEPQAVITTFYPTTPKVIHTRWKHNVFHFFSSFFNLNLAPIIEIHMTVYSLLKFIKPRIPLDFLLGF